jgi:hypothetical protein
MPGIREARRAMITLAEIDALTGRRLGTFDVPSPLCGPPTAGIEDGLSVHQETGLSVWAAGAASGMPAPILASGKGPRIIQLSQRRIGVRVRDKRAWRDDRADGCGMCAPKSNAAAIWGGTFAHDADELTRGAERSMPSAPRPAAHESTTLHDFSEANVGEAA